jgi:hypothetical protein
MGSVQVRRFGLRQFLLHKDAVVIEERSISTRLMQVRKTAVVDATEPSSSPACGRLASALRQRLNALLLGRRRLGIQERRSGLD